MDEFLAASDVIDWQHPDIVAQAQAIAQDHQGAIAIAKACFEWVRDHIRHSVDYQMNPVTCRASEVLQNRTGYCYAKSHLLAALLRVHQIPAGFCYQRLSMDDQGAPYCLHGLNAVYLPEVGWYRIDARGNRPGVNAQFMPPQECLAFPIRLSGEMAFEEILPEPLSLVVDALTAQSDWEEALKHLPDVQPELVSRYGLSVRR